MKIHNYNQDNEIIAAHEITKDGEKLLNKELKRLTDYPETALLDYRICRTNPLKNEEILKLFPTYNGKENHLKNDYFKDENYSYDFVAGIIKAKMGALNHICTIDNAIDLLFYKKDTHENSTFSFGAGLFDPYYWPKSVKHKYDESKHDFLAKAWASIFHGKDVAKLMIKRLNLILKGKG